MKIQRIVSLILAIFCATTLILTEGPEDTYFMGFGMFFLVVLIWFGDAMGGYIGPTAQGSITTITPGWMIRGFGWLVLLITSAGCVYQLFTGPTP